MNRPATTTPFEVRSGPCLPRQGPTATDRLHDVADHSLAGLVLGAVVGLAFVFFGLGYLVGVACVIVFGAIVASMPAPSHVSSPPADPCAAAHAHGPVDAWVGERAGTGALAAPCGRLAMSASRDLRRHVGVEEICRSIERRDAARVIAASKRRAIQ